MKRRHLILLLGGGTSGAISIGTNAFSTAEVERGVTVNVVSNDKAYVGYNSDDRVLSAERESIDSVNLVTVENRFTQPIQITNAVLENGADSVTELHVPDTTIHPGNEATVTADPDIDPGETVDVAITITVEATKSGGVTAELFGKTETRQFTVKREESGATDPSGLVHYNGRGTLRIENRDNRDDPTSIDVYAIPNGSTSKKEKRESLSNPQSVEITPGKNKNFPKQWVVAVNVDGTVYQHPGWNDSTCQFESSKGGDGIIVEEPPSCSDE